MGVTVQQGYTASSSSGGMTLLGTLTTTSGTTQSLTSIAAGYRALYCEHDGVSSNTGTTDTLRVALSSTNGAAYGTAVNYGAAVADSTLTHGALWINNISSTTAAAKTLLIAVTNPAASLTAGISTNTAAVVDAIRFSFASGASFDAGTIRIYGVK